MISLLSKKQENNVLSINKAEVIKDEAVAVVRTTKDYSKFKMIRGNRGLNRLHLERLEKSITKRYLFTPIIVNENFEIIDGQHRFEVVKKLGFNINYIQIKNYGLYEVQILNSYAKNWNLTDIIDGYCNLGNQNYMIFKSFQNKYNLGTNEAMILLGLNRRYNRNQEFKEGNMKIKDLHYAEVIAERIIKFEHIYKGYKRRSFVLAIVEACKHNDFDFELFCNKVKKFPTMLTDCATTKDYLRLFEQIYNYKRKNRIYLTK